MTGRTHDLTSFTALSLTLVYTTIPDMSLATAVAALGACFIGGLAPDIDQPTADLYRRLPAGTVIARLVSPILGGHRFISHSLLGVLLFGWILKLLLVAMQSIILVDSGIIWTAFMIGYVAHLLVDMLTKEGVPWLFPIPFAFGIPPIQAMRIRTGEFIEKSVIFPSLLAYNIFLYVQHYPRFLWVLRQIVH